MRVRLLILLCKFKKRRAVFLGNKELSFHVQFRWCSVYKLL